MAETATAVPTCIITGVIVGHPNACGDCDPCALGWSLVPDAVKRLIAEVSEWREEYSRAAGECEDTSTRLSRLEAALREAREALWMANRDKESVLKRIETEIRSAEALPNTGEINQLLRAGRLGALHTLKETFLAAGWVDPRSAPALDAALAPAAPAEQDEGGER